MKEVKREDLVIGETYYGNENLISEPLIYKGKDKDSIYFLPLANKTGFGVVTEEEHPFKGCADFFLEGPPFYQED